MSEDRSVARFSKTTAVRSNRSLRRDKRQGVERGGGVWSGEMVWWNGGVEMARRDGRVVKRQQLRYLHKWLCEHENNEELESNSFGGRG